jgi:soluble lytic murein transglycosylase-like protein
VRPGFFALIALFVAPFVLFADIGVPASPEFDSEFARAAEELEQGRAEAATMLADIRTRTNQPGWQARVDMLLALDHERRKDYRAAAQELSSAPAAAIGLEPYRRWHLGRVWTALGRWDEAVKDLRSAFETEEPFAMRTAAGRDWAVALESEGKWGEAAAVLRRAGAQASLGEVAMVGAERIRVGQRNHDPGEVRSAARAMVVAGVDANRALPEFARAAVAEEIARLTPPERARFARLRLDLEDVDRAVRLLKRDNPSLWPPADRAANLLALARGQKRLGYARASEATLAKVPQDGSQASLEAKLLRVDIELQKIRRKSDTGIAPETPELIAIAKTLEMLAGSSNAGVRLQAEERLVRIASERDHFDEGFAIAHRLSEESTDGELGLEALWNQTWRTYLSGDYALAASRLERLSTLRPGISLRRRFLYWRARCWEHMGRAEDAAALYKSLAEADPADIYAFFARARAGDVARCKPPLVPDPSAATAEFRRADELLRLRSFQEAAAEAQMLAPSRGRDLRLAQADFARGRFSAAIVHAKRAFPSIGTAAEGSVPEAWRRLYYPIEDGGYLLERAREFQIEPSLLRALIRQESLFEAAAKSRAGALGLMQLMPTTARSLSKSVLGQRYRKSFLYDPGINARLGAAYLKNLLNQYDGRVLWALAAYNGGPGRIEKLMLDNPGRPEDELLETHPAFETRDYVRRITLYSDSYRELYP